MQNTRFPSRLAGATLLLTLAWTLPLRPVDAKYMMPDLVNIPVERLIKNLESLARDNPKNVEVRFNLARAHAMAYAQRTESVQILKGRERTRASGSATIRATSRSPSSRRMTAPSSR